MRIERQPRAGGVKKIVGVVFLLLALGFLGYGLTAFFKVKGLISRATVPAAKTLSPDVTLADYFNHQTPFNLILLGYGGPNHDGPYLTDSMMVVRVDPSTKNVYLISLPRDLWVPIPVNGSQTIMGKINSAYAIGLDDAGYPNKSTEYKGEAGGGNLVKTVVQEATGLKIDRFVGADFAGFVDAVNSLGGVDVNVAVTFDDWEYPIDGRENDLCGHDPSELSQLMAEASVSATPLFPCRYEHLHFDKGLTHMDGAAALKYVRSRHSAQDGTDFGRSQRQRNFLEAIKQKVVSLDIVSKFFPLLDSLSGNFKTDLSLDDMRAFLSRYNDLKDYKITSLALTTDNVLVQGFSADGQYVLTPMGGEGWQMVKEYISERIDPGKLVTSPIIKVENGTPTYGLAQKVSERLSQEGFLAVNPAEADARNYAKTTITLVNSRVDQSVLSRLKKEFGVAEVSAPALPAEEPYDILVTLGADYLSPSPSSAAQSQ